MTNRQACSKRSQPANFVLVAFQNNHCVSSCSTRCNQSDSCSSISFMDSCSTMDTSFCSPNAAISSNHSIPAAKILTASPNSASNSSSSTTSNSGDDKNQPNGKRDSTFAKRKKAILRRSSSFDDTLPNTAYTLRPRARRTRPRRHKSTGTDPEEEPSTEVEAEHFILNSPLAPTNALSTSPTQSNRWQTCSTSSDQAPRLNTSNHSRWDSGTDSAHSGRSSTCIHKPSRHDSFSESFDVLAADVEDDERNEVKKP